LYFNLQGARMLHGNNTTEMLIRRKLEEQQQAAELQQAIELQSRRLMGLQLLDLKSRNFSSHGNGNGSLNSTMTVGSPTMSPIAVIPRSNSISPDETRSEGFLLSTCISLLFYALLHLFLIFRLKLRKK
jgi:hypothetical protein